MNTKTGKVYEGAEAIDAARRRGESIQEVSPEVAELAKKARALKLEEKRERRARMRANAAKRRTVKSRNRAKVQAASRKRNLA